jgi:hypothetical protein
MASQASNIALLAVYKPLKSSIFHPVYEFQEMGSLWLREKVTKILKQMRKTSPL